MTEYYAHSPKEDIPAQPYALHVNNVRQRVCGYIEELRPYAILDVGLLASTSEIAATFHDLGKLIKENQEVLSGEKQSRFLPKNHVDAGTAYLLDAKHISPIAAVAVYAHHRGLPDFIDESIREEFFLRDKNILDETDKELPYLESIHNSLVDYGFILGGEPIKGDHYVLFRMLLSCIADADHTDTAVNYKQYPAQSNDILLRPKERLKQLDNYINRMRGEGERNALRREMYFESRDANIGSNIVSCDSPVGSGKTTAIMAHLLKQAEKRGLRRIFIVLPFTNIITQSVDVYREALVLPGEKAEEVVAELHHRADFKNLDTRYLTALWKAPIIVTTAVAFFETLASSSPAALRRLHELPGSAIFVDESHAALPVKLLPLTWRWMNIYANEWSCYWVLASGSLNRFWEIEEIVEGIENPATYVPELVDGALRSKLSVYEGGRVTYKSDLKPKDLHELSDWIVKFKGPRLVILNTVQSAAVIAKHFADSYGRESVEHLSTALLPTDRAKTLERIKERLRSPEDTNWTLIATSCVEAGMNFSFRNGFRELGSLTSLLQAAGRINREGLYEDSELWSFCLLTDYMLKTNPGMNDPANVLRSYLETDQEITPELSTKSVKDEIRRYNKGFGKLVKNEESGRFPCVQKDYKVIDTDTRITIVDQGLANRILYGKVDWKEIQNNSVQIKLDKLIELRTPEIRENLYMWNLAYDKFLGYMAGIIQNEKFEKGVLII